MTHGDASTCKCPACKKPITRPLGNNEPVRSGAGAGILEGTTRCPHCQCEVHYWARWAVAVDLEKESKVK